MHGNEASAANSMSCAERLDLCGEESGWQERGASGPGPLALGEHQRCRVCPDVLGRRHQPASSSTARRAGLPDSGGAPARSWSLSRDHMRAAVRRAGGRLPGLYGGGDMLVAAGCGRASRGRVPSPPSGRGGSLLGTVFCGPVLGSPERNRGTAIRWAASPLGLSSVPSFVRIPDCDRSGPGGRP
jgi:hypothetical protein